ncbi:hypothetical protein E2C01_058587 [Portunus trituberculatus]|uniref:Uncharacterized protein n=1 Tax=Portunus trituberculatus TaxID=210409 RepID=A0A5B7GWW5_PORTR|nr:hypothetical protein [Portunus trituberculatus]
MFGKLKNRLGMIPGRNIKRMRLRLWKAQVPFMGNFIMFIQQQAGTGCNLMDCSFVVLVCGVLCGLSPTRIRALSV